MPENVRLNLSIKRTFRFFREKWGYLELPKIQISVKNSKTYFPKVLGFNWL